MAKIILINPDYYEDIFAQSKARAAVSRGVIPLGLASLAAPLLAAGHKVRIVNLNLADNPEACLSDAIREFRPDVAGITATTPLIYKAYEIASRIKSLDRNILVLAGGPHPSAVPEEVLAESQIDGVVRGEGDAVLPLIVEQGFSPSIANLFYKSGDSCMKAERQRDFISDLDSLPFPAFELFDLKDYSQPGIASRKAPMGYMETSRGCYARCIFCNKNIHGYKMRMKSPLRVVDEMARMLRLGFQEIQIIDDIFTADMERAYIICEEILRRGLNFPWYPRGGIRVDRVNQELLHMMKRAGCYRIPFGVESGSQRILDLVKKKITLEQCERAVRLAKAAGLETECYFMIGHPTETEEDIKKSIAFAIKLNPDYAKFAITIPLPGTPLFNEMTAQGRIKTRNWDKYNFSLPPKELYDHDTLSWEVIERYYTLSHRKFYFRPHYILHMIHKTVLNGTVFAHIKAFLKTRW
jgi:anaerobic magnesium-protoporphyrin IX monomethyl ester cyclase|uniref:Radical SAM protein n=1 Tax=Desulfobacca acetoxidans TaxID=60893 RepID=A0A7V6DQ09_9BACT